MEMLHTRSHFRQQLLRPGHAHMRALRKHRSARLIIGRWPGCKHVALGTSHDRHARGPFRRGLCFLAPSGALSAAATTNTNVVFMCGLFRLIVCLF
jgi:hypothetical protein